jgi:hypothetical protein
VTFPRFAVSIARSEVTSDLPTPPLPDTTPITFLIFEYLLHGSFAGLRDEQFSPQEEQS